MGSEITDFLRGQSHKAESSSSQPVPALLARIVCMISLISVSVLHIRGSVLDLNQRSEFSSLERTSQGGLSMILHNLILFSRNYRNRYRPE